MCTLQSEVQPLALSKETRCLPHHLRGPGLAELRRFIAVACERGLEIVLTAYPDSVDLTDAVAVEALFIDQRPRVLGGSVALEWFEFLMVTGADEQKTLRGIVPNELWNLFDVDTADPAEVSKLQAEFGRQFTDYLDTVLVF